MSEFEKELEKNMKLNKVAYEKENIYSDFLISKRDIERVFHDWQPPKQLVVVPKIVAKYIETQKDNDYNGNAFLILKHYESFKQDGNDSELDMWIATNFNDFLSAIINGYTVEKPKEKLYFVKLPGMTALDAHLCKSCSPGEIGYHEVYSSKEPNKISFSSRYDKKYSGGWQRQFTESEIKAIDERYWSFAVPVEEIEP